MTNRTRVAIPLMIGLLLAACSSAQVNLGESSDGEPQESEVDLRLLDGDLPVQVQLILGTLHLESTALAVDSDQAAELVPLWKALRSLTTSDTAAEAEIKAVENQIQNTMTSEQIQAITKLGLSADDIQALIQELGIVDRFEGRNPDSAPGGGFQGAPGGGAPGGGVGGPGGGFQGGQADVDADESAAGKSERGGDGSRAGQFLFDPLIEILKKRAGLESPA